MAGRLIAAYERSEVIEGDWPGDKVVVLAFPDQGTITSWAPSSEYWQIAEDRVVGHPTLGPLCLVR
jgi:uncharacterized protein (DUF1330 family)